MLSRSLTLVAVVALSLSLMSCAKSQGDNRRAEVAKIDAKSGQDVADQRASEIESRLLRQQRFYQALKGVFAGKLRIERGNTYDVRFTITPTIPLYDGSRIRTIDEITYDLTNLAFNIEEMTTAPISADRTFSTGCNFAGVKAKIDEGVILVTSPNCAVSYSITVGYRVVGRNGSVQQASSTEVTKQVLDGEIELLNKLTVEKRSIHRGGVERFEVLRVN